MSSGKTNATSSECRRGKRIIRLMLGADEDLRDLSLEA